MHSKVREMVPAENPNKETPIWMAHGEVDPLLKLEWAVNSVGMLREWGWKVEFTTYPYVLFCFVLFWYCFALGGFLPGYMRS